MNIAIRKDDLIKMMGLSVIILITSLIVFRQYIWPGTNFFSLYYTSDLVRANLPTYTLLYDYLSNNNFHLWSWEMGLGTTILSHEDVLFDPFTYIVFLGGRSNISYMMLWCLVVKLIFEGIAFYLFLNYFKLDKRAILIGSIAYAFCGYSLIMGNNLAFGTILVYIPLLLLSVEKMINEKSYYLLIIMLVATSLLSFYFFYVSGIILVLYLAYRLNFDIKKIKKPLLFLAITAVIAMAISSPFLFTQLEIAATSPRSISKEATFSLQLLWPDVELIISCLLRSFSPSLAGVPSTSFDYFSREWFVPCLAIPFILYYLFEKRSKKDIMSIVALILVSSLPLTSFVFNGFSLINYRWMYIIHLIICLICVFSLDRIIKQGLNVNNAKKSLIFGLLILFGTLMIWEISTSVKSGHFIEIDIVSLLFIVVTYLIVIAIIIGKEHDRFKKIVTEGNRTNVIVGVVTVIMLGSIVVGYAGWYGDSNPAAVFDNGSNNGYDGWDQDIVSSIKDKDDTMFYRMYKEFDAVYNAFGFSSNNDSMVQSYYGLKCYNSLNNTCFVEFLQTLGVYVCSPTMTEHYKKTGVEPKDLKGQDLNYINGIDDKIELLDYLGVKYYMVKSDDVREIPENFRYIGTYHNISLYENTTCNGLGFINSKYMSYADFMQKSYDERVEIIQEYTILSNVGNMADNVENKSICTLTSFDDDYVSFDVNIEGEQQYVSFSIPYDPYWSVYIDGEKVDSEKINVSLLGVKVSGGEHIIELRYENKLMEFGFTLSIMTVVILICVYSFNVIRKMHN